MPYFETASILVIPVVKDNFAYRLPALEDIEYTIEKGFVNLAGIELAREYSGCYRTNGGYDISGPTLKWIGADPRHETGIYSVKGKQEYTILSWDGIDLFTVDITPEVKALMLNNGGTYPNRKVLTENEMISKINAATSLEALKTECKVTDTKTITIDGYFEIEDDSGIAEIVLTLTPVSNQLYPNQSTEKLSVSHVCDGKTKVEFGKTASENLTFNLSELDTEGVYKLYGVSVVDVVGNISEVPFCVKVGWYDSNEILQSGIASYFNPIVYCIVDNVFNCEYSYTRNANVDRRYDITGDKGKYCLYPGQNGDDITYLSKFKIKEMFKEISTKHEIFSDGGNTFVSYDTAITLYLLIQDTFGNIGVERLW